MSVESETLRGGRRGRPSEVVSGYLASLGIFTGLVAIAWHPLRLAPIAMLIALVGAAMAAKHEHARGLAFAAVAITAACFFLGMTVAVVTSHPLW